MAQSPQLELPEHVDRGVAGVVQLPDEQEPDVGLITLVLALGPTGCSGFTSAWSSCDWVGD